MKRGYHFSGFEWMLPSDMYVTNVTLDGVRLGECLDSRPVCPQ